MGGGRHRNRWIISRSNDSDIFKHTYCNYDPHITTFRFGYCSVYSKPFSRPEEQA